MFQGSSAKPAWIFCAARVLCWSSTSCSHFEVIDTFRGKGLFKDVAWYTGYITDIMQLSAWNLNIKFGGVFSSNLRLKTVQSSEHTEVKYQVCSTCSCSDSSYLYSSQSRITRISRMYLNDSWCCSDAIEFGQPNFGPWWCLNNFNSWTKCEFKRSIWMEFWKYIQFR